MMFVVSLISRYMSNPTKLHMEAANRILRYLTGTTDFGVFYRGTRELNVYTVTMLEIKKTGRALQVICSYSAHE